jgi:hypothetical protein
MLYAMLAAVDCAAIMWRSVCITGTGTGNIVPVQTIPLLAVQVFCIQPESLGMFRLMLSL